MHLADVMGPRSPAREPFRTLDATNAAVRPFLRETTPIVRDQIRPFARAGRPYVANLEPAARDLAKASPDLTETFRELNRFFNMAAYNPGGAEPPAVVGGNDTRQEGFLYWLAWTANNGVSLFSTADAQGVYRRLTICGLPVGILGAIQLGPLVRTIAAEQPRCSASVRRPERAGPTARRHAHHRRPGRRRDRRHRRAGGLSLLMVVAR